MSSLQIGRLLLGPPFQWQEQFGDPVTSVGGAIIPQPRAALRHAVDIGTLAADGATDTLAARLVIRRQLRSLLNNTPLKLQGGYYVLYSDDSENSGWYVPDQGQIADGEGSFGLATGWWKLANLVWFMAGHRRTAREGYSIWMKDLRTGLFQRDYLGWIYSTDFSALPTLQLTVVPNGATQIANTILNQIAPATALPTGRDGGTAQQLSGLADLAVIAYERPESALNLSDVIAYDRRGHTFPIAQEAIADGAAAGWLLNETSGTTAADATGNGRNATYAGGFTLAQSGIFEPSVKLNGSSGYVWAPDSPALRQNQTFTLECVVATSAVGGYALMTKGWSNITWFFETAANGQLRVYIGTNSIAAASNVGALPFDGKQHHLMVTYDGATVSFYVDGSLNSSTGGVTGQPTNSSATSVGIGTGSDSTTTPPSVQGEFYNGVVGAAFYYPVALTAAQAASHAGAVLGAPTRNPQTFDGWEEIYGPDYPFNWTTAGQPNDAPVLDNGLVRIRYDESVGVPGFKVDIWTGSAYAEQGKMVVQRIGDSTGFCDTWGSASVMEYSPNRTVISCVLRNSADTFSRERVIITLQRGELGATFECYPGIKSTGAQADALLQWTPALNAGVGDLNNSACKIDSQGSGNWTPGAAGTAVNVATAGTGIGSGNSGQFGALATLGNANFTTSENWIAVLRCPTAFGTIGAYQTTLAVVQGAGALAKYGLSSSPYGVSADTYQITSQSAAGYVQAQLYFASTQADQILEAEGITLGSGTTAATDGAATPGPHEASGTGANSTSTTRTTDANPHVTRATWPNAFLGTYRVFARVRCTASTLNVYAKTGATTGITRTTTSTAYVWLDLGEITANNTTLEIHLWATAAATCWLDRVEAYLVQDRARTSFIYSGARDFAQAALIDSRASGCLVAR